MRNVSLAVLCFVIYSNVSATHSYSAIQRYRDLHEAFRKSNLTNYISRPTIAETNLIDSNDASITQKTVKRIEVNDISKALSRERTTTPSPPFWHSSRFPIEAYSAEISSPTITDNHSTEGSASDISTSPLTTTQRTIFPESSRATTVVPFSTVTKKLSTKSSRISCTATCGRCTNITPVSGVILSSNYPGHYYSATDIGYLYCHYTINAPTGKRIKLVFQELNLAFTDWGDFIEVVDRSPENYGKVLATFNAGDEAVTTMASGESMFIFFEANQGGFTKNGKVPSWRSTYFVVEEDVEPMKSNVKAAAEPQPYLFGLSLILCLVVCYRATFPLQQTLH